MNEQRRILNTAKEDAELLSSKDEMTLSDQNGKQVDLPKAERQAIILAMSLHEKVYLKCSMAGQKILESSGQKKTREINFMKFF